VFTTIGTGFNTPAAWTTPIVVQVVDDCGNAFNTGSVIVSFSDGDPPLGMLAIGNGNWAGTWVPQNNSAGFTVRADAQQLPLTGSVLRIPATVLFAGLTPGYVGLYQVNVTMPTGVTQGSQVPVTVSVAGKSGAGNITITTH
jgi:uncharacterized protein (TIGR03437 family)